MSKRLEALIHVADRQRAEITHTDRIVELTGVTQDSRSLKPGNAFIAIRGDRFDGHEFIPQAIAAGARLIVAERPVESEVPVIVCRNSIEFIQRWAEAYRDRYTGTIISLTGTNGKTTTKEMIYAVLSKTFNTYRTPGNYNNHIGLPLTLLNLPENADYAIVELGTNHPGEIAELTQLLRPEQSLVTNIGWGHMEFFPSVEDLVEEKTNIYRHTKTNGLIYVNADDIHLNQFESVHTKRTVGIQNDADVRLKYNGMNAVNGCEASWHDIHLSLKIGGEYQLMNAAFAIAVGHENNVPHAEIEEALNNFQPVSGRMEWVNVGDFQILNDSYNANPNSTIAAVRYLASIKSEIPKLLILGEMLELGSRSTEWHQDIINEVDKHAFDWVGLTGAKYESVAGKYVWNADLDSLLDDLVAAFDRGVILIKGSRGNRLERVISGLEERLGGSRAG